MYALYIHTGPWYSSLCLTYEPWQPMVLCIPPPPPPGTGVGIWGSNRKGFIRVANLAPGELMYFIRTAAQRCLTAHKISA
jgi:hypothetical protein